MLESPGVIGIVILALVANLVGALLVYALVRRYGGLDEARRRRSVHEETRGTDASGSPGNLGPGRTPDGETGADRARTAPPAGTGPQQHQQRDHPEPARPDVTRIVTCPGCGTENRTGFRFCRWCVCELPAPSQSRRARERSRMVGP